MKPEIVVATCRNRFFGQGIKAWVSMDVDRLKAQLDQRGLQCIETSLERICAEPQCVHGRTVLYSSSQRPGYKSFIEDVAWLMRESGGKLIPSLEMLRAHENKGFQQILARSKKLNTLSGLYTTGDESAEELWTGTWPSVFKLPSGAKGTTVKLARCSADVGRFLGGFERLPLATRAYAAFKRILKRGAKVDSWYSYLTPVQPYLLQEFLPDLARDFKVIVLGRRAFVLQRLVRSGDFRASGSGKFDFIDPPDGLLEAAGYYADQLGEPCISMDLAEAPGGFALLEFQATHFGPYTVTNSPFHYEQRGAVPGTWQRIDRPVVMEEVFADAIADFVHLGARQLSLPATT